jgi:hypothetical protein
MGAADAGAVCLGWTESAIAAEVGIPLAPIYGVKIDPARAVALLESLRIV